MGAEGGISQWGCAWPFVDGAGRRCNPRGVLADTLGGSGSAANLMAIAPFVLPLSPERFAAALRKGHGRALMHARQFGLDGLHGVLVDACRTNLAFDPQLEPERSDWLIELLAEGGVETPVARAAMAKGDEPPERYWDAVHWAAMLRRFAERGVAEARPMLYGCLRRWPETADFVADDELVILDGARGLRLVAQYLGRLVADDADAPVPESAMRLYDSKHGNGAARRVLEEAARSSEDVGRYLRALDAVADEIARADADARAAEADALGGNAEGFEQVGSFPGGLGGDRLSRILEQIDSAADDEDPHGIMLLMEQPTDAELRALLELMLVEEQPGRLRRFLQVFAYYRMERFDERLIPLAGHEDAEIRWLVHATVGRYHHPSVRALGLAQLEKLAQGCAYEGQFKLLVENFEPGDGRRIEAVLPLPASRTELHSLCLDLAMLGEARAEAEFGPLAMFVYEHSPCANCRERAARLLRGTGTAPDWVLTECRYDCVEAIRELVLGGFDVTAE